MDSRELESVGLLQSPREIYLGAVELTERQQPQLADTADTYRTESDPSPSQRPNMIALYMECHIPWHVPMASRQKTTHRH